MGASCDIGAGETIGSVGDRKGSSGLTWLDASDDAEGSGTGRGSLSKSRLNCVGRAVSPAASLAALARSLRLRSFSSSAFARALTLGMAAGGGSGWVGSDETVWIGSTGVVLIGSTSAAWLSSIDTVWLSSTDTVWVGFTDTVWVGSTGTVSVNCAVSVGSTIVWAGSAGAIWVGDFSGVNVIRCSIVEQPEHCHV